MRTDGVQVTKLEKKRREKLTTTYCGVSHVLMKMNLVCGICCNSFLLRDSIHDASATPCGHVFHYPCLKRSLDKASSCPKCRAPVWQDKVTRLHLNFGKCSFSNPVNFDLSPRQQFQKVPGTNNFSQLAAENTKLNQQIDDLREKLVHAEIKANRTNGLVSSLKNVVFFLAHQIVKKNLRFDKNCRNNPELKRQFYECLATLENSTLRENYFLVQLIQHAGKVAFGAAPDSFLGKILTLPQAESWSFASSNPTASWVFGSPSAPLTFPSNAKSNQKYNWFEKVRIGDVNPTDFDNVSKSSVFAPNVSRSPVFGGTTTKSMSKSSMFGGTANKAMSPIFGGSITVKSQSPFLNLNPVNQPYNFGCPSMDNLSNLNKKECKKTGTKNNQLGDTTMTLRKDPSFFGSLITAIANRNDTLPELNFEALVVSDASSANFKPDAQPEFNFTAGTETLNAFNAPFTSTKKPLTTAKKIARRIHSGQVRRPSVNDNHSSYAKFNYYAKLKYDHR